jgi:hypothetical protein
MPDEKESPKDEEPDESPSAKARWNELLSDIDMHGVPRIQMDLHIAKKVIWVVVMLMLLSRYKENHLDFNKTRFKTTRSAREARQSPPPHIYINVSVQNSINYPV